MNASQVVAPDSDSVIQLLVPQAGVGQSAAAPSAMCWKGPSKAIESFLGAFMYVFRLTWYFGPLRNVAMPLASLWLLTSSPFWIFLAIPLGLIAMRSPWLQIWDKSKPEAVALVANRLWGEESKTIPLLKRVVSPVFAATTAAALSEGARVTFDQIFEGILKHCFKVSIKAGEESEHVRTALTVLSVIAAGIGLLTFTPQFLLYLGHALSKINLDGIYPCTRYTPLQILSYLVAATAGTGNYFFGKQVAGNFFHLSEYGSIIFGLISSVAPFFLNLDADELWKGVWHRKWSGLSCSDAMAGLFMATISGLAGVFPALNGNLKSPTFGSKPLAIYCISIALYYNISAKLFAEYRDRHAKRVKATSVLMDDPHLLGRSPNTDGEKGTSSSGGVFPEARTNLFGCAQQTVPLLREAAAGYGATSVPSLTFMVGGSPSPRQNSSGVRQLSVNAQGGS